MPRSALDFDIRGGRSKEANLPDQNAQRLEQTAHALTTKSGWGEDPPSNVSISFDDGTRTFTITPSGSTFEYWIQGVKYTKTSAETVIITDTEGLWYIFYSGNTLTASQSLWNNGDGSIVFVGIVHWDATNNVAIIVGWELHPYDMGVDTHKLNHETRGTAYETGLTLVVGTGGDDGKIAIDGGRIHDESIVIVIVDGAGSGLWEQELGNTSVFAAAQIPVYYRSGASAWRKYSAGDFPFYDNSGGDNVHYNSYSAPNWASSAASSSAKYIAMWIFGTNDISEPVIAIMGQIESNTLNAAKDANTLETLDFGTLPFSEMKILYRLIFKSNSTWAHTEEMRSVNNVPGGTYVPLTHPISDDVFSLADWDGVTTIAGSKNTIRDILNTLGGGEVDALVQDDVYGVGWNGDTTHAPSQNTVYDKIESMTDFTPPIGYISMFSGAWTDNVTIPGWYKCDGNNGTVNLVGKFVRGGATSGATGGSDNAIVVQHNHGGSIGSDGGHAHDFNWNEAGSGVFLPLRQAVSSTGVNTESGIVESVGNHNHSLTVNNEGVSGSGANKPAYYTLIFIQRIS